MRGEGRYGVGVVGASVPVFADNSELIKRATRRRIHLGTQSDINSVYDNNNKTTIEALITKGDNNEWLTAFRNGTMSRREIFSK